MEIFASEKGCGNCEVTKAEFICSRCGIRHYCSSKCQQSDWWRHKIECKNMKKEFIKAAIATQQNGMPDVVFVPLSRQDQEKYLLLSSENHELVQAFDELVPPNHDFDNITLVNRNIWGELVYALDQDRMFQAMKIFLDRRVICEKLIEWFPDEKSVGNRYVLITFVNHLDAVRACYLPEEYTHCIKVMTAQIPGPIAKQYEKTKSEGCISVICATLDRIYPRMTLSKPASVLSLSYPVNHLHERIKDVY